MLRVLPLGTACATIATEVGKQSDIAIPCMARNMISWMPVRDSPHARIKMLVRKQPNRLTRLLPITSAMEPARRRHELLVKLYILSIMTRSMVDI
jgi:hypothetical protein